MRICRAVRTSRSRYDQVSGNRRAVRFSRSTCRAVALSHTRSGMCTAGRPACCLPPAASRMRWVTDRAIGRLSAVACPPRIVWGGVRNAVPPDDQPLQRRSSC